jgi:hypothetical protein
MDDNERLMQLAEEAEQRRIKESISIAKATVFAFGAAAGFVFMVIGTFNLHFHFWPFMWFAIPIALGTLMIYLPRLHFRLR